MREWFELADRIVRPLLAVMFGGAFIYGTLFGYTMSDGFVAVATAVVLWYFKSRDDEKAQARLVEVNKENVELAKQVPLPESRAA
jgi:hypothetical protein